MNARTKLWNKVYRQARTRYRSLAQYEDRDAKLTADAAAGGWYSGGVIATPRRRTMPKLGTTPRPGDAFEIGVLLEVEFVDRAGNIVGFSFDESDGKGLVWSRDRNALYCFPRERRGPCNMPPRARENAISKVFARGKPADCSLFTQIQCKPLPYAYPAVQVSYRSDKFSLGTNRNYIHHHGPGVRVHLSSDYRRGCPDVIMIRGGKLALKSHGIDG